MRTRPLALCVALSLAIGCGAAPRAETRDTPERLRAELYCTERAESPAEGESGCRARGCQWSAPLICRGMQAPPDVLEEERRSAEAGEPTCTCVCAQDIEACSMVP